jgi:hypothetical protein
MEVFILTPYTLAILLDHNQMKNKMSNSFISFNNIQNIKIFHISLSTGTGSEL